MDPCCLLMTLLYVVRPSSKQRTIWRGGDMRLERIGMKVSRSKTEYMCMNGSGKGKICLQKEELKKVNEFKYLGTTMVSNGEYSRGEKQDSGGMEQLEKSVCSHL